MSVNGVVFLLCACLISLCRGDIQFQSNSSVAARFRELSFSWPVAENFDDDDLRRVYARLQNASLAAIISMEGLANDDNTTTWRVSPGLIFDQLDVLPNDEMDSTVRRVSTLAATASGSPLERNAAVEVVELHQMLVHEKAMHNKADDDLTILSLKELAGVSPTLADEIRLAADKPLLVRDRRFAITNLTSLIGAMGILIDEHPQTIANIIGWRLAQRWSLAADAAAKRDDTWDSNTIAWLCILLGCAVILGVAVAAVKFRQRFWGARGASATSTPPQQYEMQQVSRPPQQTPAQW